MGENSVVEPANITSCLPGEPPVPLPEQSPSFVTCNDGGFTLLEVLVALTILAIGVMAVVSMQTVAMRSNTIAYRITAASNLGQEALEDILSKDITDPIFLTSVNNQVYDLDPDTAATTRTVAGAGTYGATYSTTVGPDGSGNIPSGITKVTVTITGTGINPVSFTGYKRTI